MRQRAAQRHQVRHDPPRLHFGFRKLPTSGHAATDAGPQRVLGTPEPPRVGCRPVAGIGVTAFSAGIPELLHLGHGRVDRVRFDPAVHLGPVVPQDVVGNHTAQAVPNQDNSAVAVFHQVTALVVIGVEFFEERNAASHDVVAAGDVLRVDVEVTRGVADDVEGPSEEEVPRRRHNQEDQQRGPEHGGGPCDEHRPVRHAPEKHNECAQGEEPGAKGKMPHARPVGILRLEYPGTTRQRSHGPTHDVRHLRAVHLVGPVVLVEVGLRPLEVDVLGRALLHAGTA